MRYQTTRSHDYCVQDNFDWGVEGRGGGGKGGRRKRESQVGAWGGWGFAGYIPIEHFDTAFSKITENAFTIAKELFNYKLSAQCLLYRGW